jgi:hypothetical protein
MAIGDHAISDRAISAPADVVVVGVTFPGRCVVRDLPACGAEVFDSPAVAAWASSAAANQATVADAPAGRSEVSDGAAGSVEVGSFPL